MGKATRFKPVAWNGIYFDAPRDWEIAELGKRHLLLEKTDRPVLEAKWGTVKGALSHRKQLRRLSRGKGAPASPSVQTADCPRQWTDALAAYEVSCFTWQGSAITGAGIILYCPPCRQAILLQFFHPQGPWEAAWIDPLLRSFTDHAPGAETLWSVFDIRVKVPERFHLAKHRFEPGAYQLDFQSRSEALTIYRWGPATVLLANTNLTGFAQRMNLIGPEATAPAHAASAASTEWSWAAAEGGWAQFWQRVRRSRGYARLRLWHSPVSNRVLGVHLASRHMIDISAFDSLCASYETV